MTPQTFLQRYSASGSRGRGDRYSGDAVPVSEGDCVGVVLMGAGGPQDVDDVGSYLYNLYMDPVRVDVPVGSGLRHWLARGYSLLRSGSLAQDYEAIGGASPVNRLSREQEQSLEDRLNETFGRPAGVTFRTYRAMRYSEPSSEEAASQMEADGVDSVVLLPLYPQYGRSTTGASLAYWHALVEAGEIPSWPTTVIREYAANPRLLQAVSERINEALQRYPSHLRDRTRLVFSARGAVRRGGGRTTDPYCCQVHATVDELMQRRQTSHPFEVTFREGIGLGTSLEPSTEGVLERLGRGGTQSVLVVPISSVTDSLATKHRLDIALRETAERAGILHYEVTSGLNTHPLLIDALAEATVAQVRLPVDAGRLQRDRNREDRSQVQTYPLRPPAERDRLDVEKHSLMHADCSDPQAPSRWTSPPPDGRSDHAPRDADRRSGTDAPAEAGSSPASEASTSQ